jgi:hypothetical protein
METISNLRFNASGRLESLTWKDISTIVPRIEEIHGEKIDMKVSFRTRICSSKTKSGENVAIKMIEACSEEEETLVKREIIAQRYETALSFFFTSPFLSY